MLPTDEETPDERYSRLQAEEPEIIAELDCPDCGAPMELRLGHFGRFYGCSTWAETRCRGTVSAHDDGTPFGEPAPTGSPEKDRRRKLMRHRNPPTRWQRLMED